MTQHSHTPERTGIPHWVLPMFLLLVGVMFSGCEPVGSQDSGLLQKAQAALVMDRAWDETTGNYRSSYALVSWKNELGRTFRQVTIQATAFDTEGKKIDQNERSFFSHERGPIAPGFEGTLKIPVEIGNARFGKMRVSVISIK